MPVLKHAKKKLRQDKKRTIRNHNLKDTYKELVKAARTNPSVKTLSVAFKQVDKAAKNHILHPNKAARLKSSLSKLTPGVAAVKEAKPKTKKATRANVIANKSSAKAAKGKSKAAK